MRREMTGWVTPLNWFDRSGARMVDGARGVSTQEGCTSSSNQGVSQVDGTHFEPFASSTGGMGRKKAHVAEHPDIELRDRSCRLGHQDVDRPQLVHKRSNHPPTRHAVTDQCEAPAHLAGASHLPSEGSRRWPHAVHRCANIERAGLNIVSAETGFRFRLLACAPIMAG